LLSKGKFEESAWQNAAGGHIEVLKELWNWAKKLQLKPEELRNKLLLSKDECKETAWHKQNEEAKLKF